MFDFNVDISSIIIASLTLFVMNVSLFQAVGPLELGALMQRTHLATGLLFVLETV